MPARKEDDSDRERMGREELRMILEQIVRDEGNQAARVAAARQLLRMLHEEEDGAQETESSFDELDEARRYRIKAA
jgi:hypothetical protein